MSTGTCACGTTETHPATECVAPWETPEDVQQADLRALLEALGLGTHARPYSAHAVIHREVLPALRDLADERTAALNLAAEMINHPDDSAADWGYNLAHLLDRTDYQDEAKAEADAELCACGHRADFHGRRDAQTAWQSPCYADPDCDCDDVTPECPSPSRP